VRSSDNKYGPESNFTPSKRHQKGTITHCGGQIVPRPLPSALAPHASLKGQKVKGRGKRLKADIALHGNPMSKLSDVTCQVAIWDHSVTCLGPSLVRPPSINLDWRHVRNCGSTRSTCRTLVSVNHSPLNCFGYVTFRISIEDSLLSVGVLFGGSRPSRSVVFAQWSPTPPKPLTSMIRYVAVSNELESLSFALYRGADVNACYVNETATLLMQSTEQLFQVRIISYWYWRHRLEASLSPYL